MNGKFLQAIESVNNTDEVARWYYNLKSNAGTTSANVIAQRFLQEDIDLSNYLVKRIILIETFTEFYKEGSQ